MIEGKEGVERMIAQQRAQKESVQDQILRLQERYQDLEEMECSYQKKKEEFCQIMTQRREKAQKVAQCSHPPSLLKEFSSYLDEELYGSDYEAALENVSAFGAELLREKGRLSEEIAQEEAQQQQLDQRILSLERLLL